MTEEPAADRPAVPRWVLVVFALLAVAVPLAYSLLTHHIWEDFFILFRHSRNLAEGNGLVFTPGERVHGYTSPLGVLMPALTYTLSGKVSYVGAIWGYRIANIIAFVWAGLLILRTLTPRGRNSMLAAGVFSALYLFEAKTVVYLSSGMETAFVILFLAAYLHAMQRGLDNAWKVAGLSCAGLMWSRPDCALYIAALFVGTLLFTDKPWKQTFHDLLKVAGLCAVLYLPWFVGAWIYYGSPVPHSVVAKSAILERFHLSFAEFEAALQSVFSPVYFEMGGWPAWVKADSMLLTIIPSLYWLMPTKDRMGRIASFTFFCLLGYYAVSPRAPWYFPPMAFLGIVVLARATLQLTIRLAGHVTAARVLVGVFLAVFGLTSARLMFLTTWQMHLQQKIVEDGNRTKLGLWMREHIEEDESAYLEALGYLGYFSRARIDDFPGLVSPRVVELLEETPGANFATIVPALQPDWIVARPWRREKLEKLPDFREHYQLEQTFDVTPELESARYVPGKGYLYADAIFYVFHRVDASPPSER